jgi:hypothetical protein
VNTKTESTSDSFSDQREQATSSGENIEPAISKNENQQIRTRAIWSYARYLSSAIIRFLEVRQALSNIVELSAAIFFINLKWTGAFTQGIYFLKTRKP